jgi:hypothetical protein
MGLLGDLMSALAFGRFDEAIGVFGAGNNMK